MARGRIASSKIYAKFWLSSIKKIRKQPMGLTMKEKKAISKEIAKRYKKARKREKGRQQGDKKV